MINLKIKHKAKECYKCGKIKELTEFNNKKDTKDGLQSCCRLCVNEKKKIYRNRHKEKIKLAGERYRKNNKEGIRLRDKEYRLKNKEKIKLRAKKYNSRPEIKEKRNVNQKLKIKTDPNFKLTKYLRGRTRKVLIGTNKSAKTLELLGCTIDFLWGHLKSKFQPGMTTENYGKNGWHVDHIIPCAAFDLSIPENQRKCFHYSNLQPLWAKDNLEKADKVLPEFTYIFA